MKRRFIGLVLFVLMLLFGTYLILPTKIVVKQSAFLNASDKSTYRCLTESSMIQKWWNADHKLNESINSLLFTNNDWEYQFIPLMYNGVKVNMRAKNHFIQSVIAITALEGDSSFIQWKVEWPVTKNPFTRLQQYWLARQVKEKMIDVLQQFTAFANRPEKIFGLQIKKTKVTDTLIVTTKKIFKNHPSTDEYYKMIDNLKQYITPLGVQATNYPMLNISPIGANEFGVMVGIPVNKAIPETDGIQLKRMIPGNILVTEVTGGVYNIEKAMQEMHNYIQENGLLPPAIPYQSLITDRKAEADTLRWITKLYFPVY